MFSLKPRQAWFLAFTAAFAVLAGFVFWGTWSADVNPVMPDCRHVHATGYFAPLAQYFAADCLRNWQFVPDDLMLFLGTPYFRQELQYAIAAWFAALGLVYYCRGRGLSRAAAYSAALLLAFSGYWFSLYSAGHYGWFRLMTYCIFVFGLADRMVRKGKMRHAVMLGALVAWGCRNQQDMWMIFTLFAGAYFIWCCVRERKFPLKDVLIAALTFAIIGGANVRTAFTEALSLREQQLEESKGSALSGGEGKSDKEANWIFVTNWSMPPEDTLEFFIPRIHGDTSCPFVLSLGGRFGTGVEPYTGRLGRPIDAKDGNYRQHSLYVGLVTCLLALAGIVGFVISRRKGSVGTADAPLEAKVRSDIPFFIGAAVLFWLLSMGRFFEPLYRVVFSIPFLDSLRAPVKWHHATEFALAVLAAYGFEFLAAYLPRRFALVPKKVLAALIVLALAGAVDLARIDHLYIAPVDMREVKRQNANMQLTFLPRAQLLSKEAAPLVRAKRLIPLATYPGQKEVYLVEYLTPRKPSAPEPPPTPLAKVLGLVSILGTIAASAYSIKKS